jgi:hypothetical protein
MIFEPNRWIRWLNSLVLMQPLLIFIYISTFFTGMSGEIRIKSLKNAPPSIGTHSYSGLIDITAEQFIDCPDSYQFDHWLGDVSDPDSASTSVYMGSDKTITAVFVNNHQCGDECHPNNNFGDYNHDCIINLEDFAQFALNWMLCTKPECD